MSKYTLIVVLVLLSFNLLTARPWRVDQIPNGTVNTCANCHVNPAGGGERNAFGQLVEAQFLDNGNVVWGIALASLDADADGISNGSELQDPYGLWESGQPAPGNANIVTLPGSAESNTYSTATIQFAGMNPHNGQKLELRALDLSNNKEIFRETISAINSSDFSITLDSIILGHSYMIDFYADFNGNGKYDAPPADHAWRLFLNDAQGDDVVTFTHNTAFTDIKWPNLLTIQFTGMTPHNGQLLELRVEEDNTSKEIGRVRIEPIQQADFNISIPGIEPGKEYNIEFYADFNGNGLYDAPPTDHAWEIKLGNSTGDTTVTFSHNTSFTDINWKYLFTINFTNMTPHLGQKFELRIVKQDDGSEVGRVSLDSILVPAFSVSVPGIEPGHSYNADFYADFNKNGQYDAPPADHAYRIAFTAAEGNHVESMAHNTNFTDIEWPGFPTDVDEDNSTVAKKYSLEQNYPNPFNPSTQISYSIPAAGKVTLKIYNTLGKEIAVLVDREQAPGNHIINFNAAGLPSGVYFYELRTNSFVQTRKMVLLR